jgi:hypothetical protein
MSIVSAISRDERDTYSKSFVSDIIATKYQFESMNCQRKYHKYIQRILCLEFPESGCPAWGFPCFFSVSFRYLDCLRQFDSEVRLVVLGYNFLRDISLDFSGFPQLLQLTVTFKFARTLSSTCLTIRQSSYPPTASLNNPSALHGLWTGWP